MRLARHGGWCLLVAVVGVAVVTDGEEVTLPWLGRIEGTTTRSYLHNRTIYQYQGIPFAEPPLGDLRFKRPVKWTSPWSHTRQCTSFGPICPQNLIAPLKTVQSEDCLHINVYTTKLVAGGSVTGQPVMVYIHGGSFRVGSAQNIQPDYLLDEDVVLVVPQYRLGPLGFLSLKTEDIPGNMGMLDVILALEWVRDNIHVFGGDPNRVTLFGQSAGAAAVSLMLFSPLVGDGLIQRVIAQSGSAVSTWVTDPEPIRHTQMIAAHALCDDTTDFDLLAECLRNRTYKEVLDAHTQFLIDDIIAGGRAVGGNHIVWDEAGDLSFLPKDPSLLLQEGKFRYLPMMAGITKHEGSWFLGNIYDLFLVPQNLTDPDSPDTIEYMKHDMTRRTLQYGGIDDRTGYVESALQDMYFEDEDVGNFTAMTAGLVDIIGVALLKASTFTMLNAMSRRETSYMYSFNFFGRHSTFNDEGHYPFPGGIAHSDELFYIFPQGKVLNAAEQAMARRMVELWTNFAKSGVPWAENCCDWPPMTTAEGPYLRIDTEPKVYHSFTEEEYRIAVKEGLTESSVTSNHASVIYTALILSIHLIYYIST